MAKWKTTKPTGRPKQPYCKRGHRRTQENTSSWGQCLLCQNERNSLRRLDGYDKKQRAKNIPQHMITRSRGRALRRGLEFGITVDDILPLPKLCPVLGIELDYMSSKPTDNCASIDRTDNGKGYVKGNVAIISYKANRLKHSFSIEEVQRLLAYMERK